MYGIVNRLNVLYAAFIQKHQLYFENKLLSHIFHLKKLKFRGLVYFKLATLIV